MDQLMVIDGNSLMFRAFYALPPLTSPDGQPTQAIHGFFNMLLKLVQERKPRYVAVAFDLPGGTFRHEEYTEYKAGRRKTPPELHSQIPLMQDLLAQMGICVMGEQGFEADDILGTLAAWAEERAMPALLVTGDKDALQLVSGSTTVILTKKGISETADYTPERLGEEYGLTPERMPDLKGLMGDHSDNLPGIPGVGEKTALKLLSQFGTLENALQHAAEAPEKLPLLLQEHADFARMSRRLAIIRRDAPVAPDPACMEWPQTLSAQCHTRLLQLGLKGVAARFETEESKLPPKRQAVTLTRQDELRVAVERLARAKRIALELGEPWTIAGEDEEGIYCYAVDTALWSEIDGQGALEAIAPLLREERIPKVVYDVRNLRGQGLELAPPPFDVQLAAYVLDANRGKASPESLAAAYLEGEANGKADALLELQDAMRKRMEAEGSLALFEEVEMPLSAVLADMERLGFYAEPDTLKELGAQYQKRLGELEKEIYELAGAPFNINSPKQLGAVLFEQLGLPAPKKTKTGYSTDVGVLEQFAAAHPIIPLIMEHRQLFKLKSTYADGLLAAIDGRDGRIHSHFQQTVTATGRISSTEPNLQNIPVRTALGREMRRVFKAPQPGWTLVDADYSQIELRILAHMSGDAAFIEAFNNGEDIHSRTAARVNGVPLEAVTPQMRSRAKAVNFGIVYGISDFRLSRQLGISRAEATQTIAQYFAAYPGVKAYLDAAVERAKRDGYVTTLMGRRRYVPELNSTNYNTRSFGERVA